MEPNCKTLNKEKWINGMKKTYKRVDDSWTVGHNALCDKIHVDVHAWNYVILLDFNNKLCAGTELHVVVHAWNYVILLDPNNKLCAGTETHVDVSCWFVLSAVNQCSLSNYGVWNELAFVVELCCLLRIRYLLSNYGVCSELTFVVELCCLQRINVRWWIIVSAAN